MGKKDLFEKEDVQLTAEEVNAYACHDNDCTSKTNKACETDCWPVENCYLSCNK